MTRNGYTQLAETALAEVTRLREAIERLQESMQYEEAREEAFSVEVAGNADGAAVTEVVAEPAAGEVWRIAGIAVVADVAAHEIIVYFGPRVIGLFATTASGAHLPQPFDTVLPDGLNVRAEFPAAVPAGTTCRLHVWGERYTSPS